MKDGERTVPAHTLTSGALAVHTETETSIAGAYKTIINRNEGNVSALNKNR